MGGDGSRPLQPLVESALLYFEEASWPCSIPVSLGLACEDLKTSLSSQYPKTQLEKGQVRRQET